MNDNFDYDYIISEINKYQPEWNKNLISLEKTKNGLSNLNFYVIYKNDKKYFLKYYINKYIDLENNNNLYNLGFGNKILYSFKGGHLEKLIDGKNLEHSDLNGNTLKKLALLLRKFHNITNMNHNDLNMTNIMINKDNDLILIDFEFIGNLDIYYDIANFFIQYMYDYNSKEWYRYDLDKFISQRHFDLFCKEYFQETNINIIKEHQQKIFSKTNSVISYWIDWANNFNNNDYLLYKLYKKELIDFNFITLFERKVIYCDGTFDLPHTGHLQFFEKILDFNCKKLIVGIFSDKDVESYKRKPILNSQTRGEIIRAFNYVDEVVIDCPLNKIENFFLDFYGIDIVVYGCDPKLSDPLGTWKYHYSIPIEQNILIMIDYSENI